MKTHVNTIEFDKDDKGRIDFFNAHGWVVVRSMFSPKKCDLLTTQYTQMKQDCANQAGVNLQDYEAEITQWRDLWCQGGAFKAVIFAQESLHHAAQQLMHWRGVKLLHDHIITKPRCTQKSVIPWHQDSMFWPVDSVGCSALTALNATTLQNGCLEVMDASHLNGCHPPVDFMAPEQQNFPSDAVRVLLPTQSGSTVFMHSLCWHRSSTNTSTSDRAVHISLWVSKNARWKPALADWHPVNQNVESLPDEVLTGAMFPAFGADELIPPEQVTHAGSGAQEAEFSMFQASVKIKTQILTLLDMQSDEPLSALLKTQKNSQKIVQKLRAYAIGGDEKSLKALLYRVQICAHAFEQNHARNVFNTTFAEWRDTIGEKLDAVLENTPKNTLENTPKNVR